MSLEYPHEWIALDDIRGGQVFWAAFKNPYYRNVSNRLYLMVSTARETIGERYKTTAIAVVGLESNGGLGKSCYGPKEQTYLMGIKLHHNTPVDIFDKNGWSFCRALGAFSGSKRLSSLSIPLSSGHSL